MIFYEPGSRDRPLLPHDPFKALVVPRPIGWISTTGADGSINLRTIARCGGPGDYTLIEHIFEMLLPQS